jgi:hypothetical protein
MRQRLQDRDAARFSGRERELALIDRVLGDDAPATVVLVHGPGGVGKSTLLREAARRGEKAGYRVAWVDGREGAALEPAVAALRGAERPLLLIDTFERISAVGGQLRDEVLAELTEHARVIIGGRAAPEAAWSQEGWDALTLELALQPLSDEDARDLLARRGIEDEEMQAALVHWARGLPLALAVAADSVIARGAPPVGKRLDDDAQLAGTLMRRLADDELRGADREVLAAASIAVAVDARLLAAVLPGVDGDHAEAWLRSLSFSERHGTRVALHERVRVALRRDLAERDPGHERELRRAIADHLHNRAVHGEPWLVVDTASLIDDPAVRWGFSVATDRHRIDDVRPGDAETAAAALGAEGTAWWSGVQRFIDEAPDPVAVVREATGALAGLCISVTPENAPAWAADDSILGPWLAHARLHWPDGDVLLWRDSLDLTPRPERTPDSPVAALLNTAANLRSGQPNVRVFYGPLDPNDERARALSEAIGARPVPDLDVTDGERRVGCHVLDHGPGGVIGTVRSFVYRDLGLTPPAAAPKRTVDADAVRDALRSFHDPSALAGNPLAAGATPAERAASVQALLRRATAAAFGDSTDERLQRATIERGYLDPGGGHTRAAHELSLSRTTYFRRLAAAATRVAEFVLADR